MDFFPPPPPPKAHWIYVRNAFNAKLNLH
jgi:hypothetical protein